MTTDNAWASIGVGIVVVAVAGPLLVVQCACGRVGARKTASARCRACFGVLRKHALPLAGTKFGRWLVLETATRCADNVRCRCECGLVKPVLAVYLATGRSRGCRRCGAINRRTQLDAAAGPA